ncbi:ArnT family glycosyltransferase [Granulicella arctica]|uniref:ArnT family glycosyltransferase n=1 Tax=Granulicella arctica TaxID=940613 RepID=UPI0021E08371|nr:hypothetical protein [Granulicella arctica]
MTESIPIPSSPRTISKAINALLLLCAGIFFALHAVHLTADFPNHSPWMDWAKYTDEGWYGDAAIRHYQRGSWYVAGDFNPAAALPVWPVLELLVFRFTGVSLSAARGLTVGIFGLILLTSYFLVRRWQGVSGSYAPAIAVLLLAVSPFCYVFTRMAILEPLLILFMLLTLLAISGLAQPRIGLRRYLLVVAIGILLPLMILTKTTAVFLFPAIAWLLWVSLDCQWHRFLRFAIPALAIAGGLWLSYFALFVRPHFLEDYRYLFSANAYTGITVATFWSVLSDTIRDGRWMGNVLYPAGLAIILIGIVRLRRRISPLAVSLLLWAAGYTSFLAYHNNLQPRYYLVLAIPLTLLVTILLNDVVHSFRHSSVSLRTIVRTAAVVALIAIALPDALQTLQYVRKPEYTFRQAAEKVRQVIASTPSQSPLMLSISGSDLSLMTGLPSICDDFGTMELAQRVATYRPGWYVAWNQVDDDKMDALTPLFHLQRVAAFPAMDDPERNLLIVYRLDPPVPTPEPQRKRKPVPRLLRTKMGQQPSVIQLEH